MKQNKIPRNEYIIQPKGKTNPYKDDVIYSDLGQWKYPGQVTRIPSNQITMQGVPYPVQGVDDTGYSQMMYPGMDYQFPGNYVTEYPIANARYGGGLPKAQKGKGIENEKDPIEHLKWGKYIDDPKRREQHIIDVYQYLMDSHWNPEYIPNFMKKEGAYGSKNRGDIAKKGADWGWDSEDITDEVLAKAWDDYYNNRKVYNEQAYGGEPSLNNIEGHYPFGGQNTKTHTHMRKGGWLDTMQDGGTKPWGEMTPKERAAYLDAKEAESKSREQAKKEYYKDWVAENYEQGAMNPLFETLAGFSPLGIIPYAMQSGVSAINNLAQGNNIEGGIDAAFALPVLRPFKKGAKNLIKKGVEKAVKVQKETAPFTYKGVVEKFPGNTSLRNDLAKLKYNFVSQKQNPKLAGTWVNQHEEFMKGRPMSPDATGIIEPPTDPNYLYNFKTYTQPPLEQRFKNYKKEDGGWLEDEYRRGGQKRKKYTSKNIQSSVNDLFMRNETLFGPAGKKRYKPGLKYKSGGGWLDNLT